jgi:hypothetical protein
MSAWICQLLPASRRLDCSASSSDPMVEGLCADSVKKHEPASDTDTAVVDSLNALDPNRPIREADTSKYRPLSKPSDFAGPWWC